MAPYSMRCFSETAVLISMRDTPLESLLTIEQRGAAIAATPKFFLNISVIRWDLTLRFGVILEPPKLDEITYRISKQSNSLSTGVTGSEEVVNAFLV